MIVIKFLTSPGCSECEKAKLIIEDVRKQFKTVDVREIDVMSPEGIELVTKYGIMASPGIVINDELFSVGSLDKNEFIKKLKKI